MNALPSMKASQSEPLIQMSVHSLPDPSSVNGPASTQRTRAGRLKMLLVWIVCAAPVVASYLSFYVFRPQGGVNYGDLILPPKPIPSASVLKLTDMGGQVVMPASLKGQWLLVVVAGGACDAACERQLYLQRQLRETLGKDKDRVDRVWFITDQAPVRPALLPALRQATLLRADLHGLAQWLVPADHQSLSAHLYLVDPHGDWMMRFPAQAEPSRIQKDLTRLMKANESWDQPGR
jgi:cytochrome oxidase Cu insertion factor (SCO1/SenC/PrrC family)